MLASKKTDYNKGFLKIAAGWLFLLAGTAHKTPGQEYKVINT